MGIVMYFLSFLMSLARKYKASPGRNVVAYTTRMSMSRGFSEYSAEPKINNRVRGLLVPRFLRSRVVSFFILPDMLEIQSTHELSEHK